MSLVSKIKDLAHEKKVSLAEIERAIQISNGQIRRWDNVSPKTENLQKVADYFDVSIDYLLGRTENVHGIVDDRQRALSVEEAINSVMSYDGEPLTENDREIIRGIVEAYLDKK